MDTHFSFMTSEPNNNTVFLKKCKQSGCQIPVNSLEPNKIIQSHNSAELQTESQSNSCLAPWDLTEINVVEPQVDSGREKLKRHWKEVAADRVLIPDRWGHEELLNDWIDYSSFDALLAPTGFMSAREALVAQGRRSTSPGFRIC